MMNRRDFTCAALATFAVSSVELPLHAAWTSTRSTLELQQAFLDLRFGMFLHLNMATYEEREWGDPLASPKLFNPYKLNTDQWATAARSANMQYGCLTTKHHDGFCLWPTATSSPSVKDATFTKDVVRAYVDSFLKQGLQPCLYYSMLDLRADIRPYQVTRAKIDMIKAQLTELLTHYGPIPMLVFDGWNAFWSRLGYDQISYREIYDLVKGLQPDCLISEHNASQFPVSALYYTDIKHYEQRAGQKIPEDSTIPSQSGTTLQSDWFWLKNYPTQEMKPAKQIVDEWLIPFNERYCNLILNVSPNREGEFDANAIDRLAEIGRLWKYPGKAPRLAPSIEITTPNLAYAQPSFASRNQLGIDSDLAVDNDFETFWVTEDDKTGGWLEVEFRKPTPFNTIAIVEPRYIDKYGPASRIATYQVQYWGGGQWVDIVRGSQPATCQFHQFKTLTAQRVRITVQSSSKAPGIAEFGIYNEPAS